jgi:hypothetical protein
MAVPVSYYGVSYYETGPAWKALKIIWQFHVDPVHQKVSRFFGPRYRWDDIFLGPNLVSFNRYRNYSAILATLQIASYALGV